MVNKTRKRLNGRTVRFGAALGGWGGLIFGLPFLGAGALIICRATGVITQGKINAPPFVIGILGGIFALAGLFMIFKGITSELKKNNLARQKEMFPAQPWMYDFKWSKEGMKEEVARKLAQPFLSFVFMSLFMVPFNWWAFFSRDGAMLVKVITVFFDLCILGLLGWGFYRLSQYFKYGRSEIIFPRFPFFLGETLELQFRSQRGIGHFLNFQLCLRAIEEITETIKTSKGTSSQMVCYEVYNDTVKMDAEGDYEAEDAALPIVFSLPEDIAGTCLDAEMPTYWELEIKAETRGVDFASTFILPVYERPE